MPPPRTAAAAAPRRGPTRPASSRGPRPRPAPPAAVAHRHQRRGDGAKPPPLQTPPPPSPLLSVLPPLAAASAAGLLGTGFDVAGPASVAQALAVLAGVVAVHEAGHFSAAVSRGVRVSAFSIGFGPALLSRVGDDGVDYSLRAIPLGGYVAFPDDDPESDVPADDPDLLKNRPLADRAAVISAGVAANLVSAAVVLLVQAGTVGVAVLDASPGVTVPRVLDGSAAAAAGLRSGDVVLAMDGVPIPPAGVDDAVARVRAAAGREMTLTGVRGPDATPFTVRVVPSPALDGSGGRIGVQLATRGVVTHRVAKGPVAIVRTAAAEYARLGGAVLSGLKGLVTNFGDAASRLAGPVAIVAAGAEVARADGAGLFQFAAIVNINLAVVNLLPLPALDGGYLALLAVEAVRGGVKLPKEVEQTIMASGLLLLMAAGAVLLVRDTLTLSGLAGG